MRSPSAVIYTNNFHKYSILHVNRRQGKEKQLEEGRGGGLGVQRELQLEQSI